MPEAELEGVSRVTVEFFGLVAAQSLRRGPDPETHVHMLKGARNAHLPLLAIPVSDLKEDVKGYANTVHPRSPSVVGSDVCLFSLENYDLNIEAERGRDHDLSGLVSLREAYTLGRGTEPYEVNPKSSQILNTVRLIGGSLGTRGESPLDSQAVVFHGDTATQVEPMFVDNVVVWRGVRSPTITFDRSGSPGPKDRWTITLKGSCRMFIYCLPASGLVAETDLADFESIFDLLVTSPPTKLAPKLAIFGYDDFPRCIPPPSV